MQEGAGVDVVTDGEMRRFLFMGPITETVEGIELVEHDSAMPWSTPEGDIEWRSPAAVTSKLRKVRSMVTEEYSYARARARLPLKVTVPSPLVLYGFWSPKHSTAAYARRLRDVRRRRRGRALGDPGARLARLRVHPGRRARARHARRPARARLGRVARLRRRADAHRGHRPHQRDGARGSPACAWASICAAATTPGCGWPAAATTTSPRRCSSAPRPSTPSSWSTTTTARARSSRSPARPTTSRSCSGSSRPSRPTLETPQELAARIDDAARFVARDQLGLSTQCGFASIAAGNPITEADEERKLRLVADTAHAVWG